MSIFYLAGDSKIVRKEENGEKVDQAAIISGPPSTEAASPVKVVATTSNGTTVTSAGNYFSQML